jgi:tetratricopeptide (TPR) repeat protein
MNRTLQLVLGSWMLLSPAFAAAQEAQTVDEVSAALDSARKLAAEGKVAEGESLVRTAAEKVVTAGRPLEAANLWNDWGVTLYKGKKPAEARVAFTEAAKAIEARTDKTPAPLLTTVLTNAAEASFSLKELPAVVDFAKRAVENERTREPDGTLPKALTFLASASKVAGDGKGQLAATREKVDVLEKRGADAVDALVPAAAELAAVEAAVSGNESATKAFERASQLADQHKGKFSPEGIDQLLFWGRNLRATGAAAASEEKIREALDRCDRRFGPDSAASLTVLTDLVSSLKLQDAGDALMAANARRERVLAIQEWMQGFKDCEEARAKKNPQGAESALKDLTAAAEAWGDSVDVKAKITGETLLQTLDRGDVEKSIAAFLNSAEQLQAAFGDKHPNVADSLLGAGAIAIQNGRTDQAIELLQRSIAADSDPQFGVPQSADTANELLGRALVEKGRFADAVGPLEQGIYLLARNEKSESKEAGTTWYHLGLCYKGLNKPRDAMASFQRSLQIQSPLLPADHPNLVKARTELQAAQQAVAALPASTVAASPTESLPGGDGILLTQNASPPAVGNSDTRSDSGKAMWGGLVLFGTAIWVGSIARKRGYAFFPWFVTTMLSSPLVAVAALTFTRNRRDEQERDEDRRALLERLSKQNPVSGIRTKTPADLQAPTATLGDMPTSR